jgi:DNA polymerase-3 subunit beta
MLEFSLDDQRLNLRCGRSRFTLSTLPASDFPSIEHSPSMVEFALPQAQLKKLIDRTAFSMAQQDVRYYLNGTLFELTPKRLRAVATDGHRLALATLEADMPGVKADVHAILPRKGVLELQRLLQDPEAEARVSFGGALFRVVTPDYAFSSKLVDGKFPDYTKVLPKPAGKSLTAARAEMKDALSRASILSNEKFRGVRLVIEEGSVQILASNQEQEEAEESVAVDYTGDRVEIGFNVSYLIDVLSVLGGESVRVQFSDGSSSVLMEDPAVDGALYVVMPMRL